MTGRSKPTKAARMVTFEKFTRLKTENLYLKENNRDLAKAFAENKLQLAELLKEDRICKSRLFYYESRLMKSVRAIKRIDHFLKDGFKKLMSVTEDLTYAVHETCELMQPDALFHDNAARVEEASNRSGCERAGDGQTHVVESVTDGRIERLASKLQPIPNVRTDGNCQRTTGHDENEAEDEATDEVGELCFRNRNRMSVSQEASNEDISEITNCANVTYESCQVSARSVEDRTSLSKTSKSCTRLTRNSKRLSSLPLEPILVQSKISSNSLRKTRSRTPWIDQQDSSNASNESASDSWGDQEVGNDYGEPVSQENANLRTTTSRTTLINEQSSPNKSDCFGDARKVGSKNRKTQLLDLDSNASKDEPHISMQLQESLNNLSLVVNSSFRQSGSSSCRNSRSCEFSDLDCTPLYNVDAKVSELNEEPLEPSRCDDIVENARTLGNVHRCSESCFNGDSSNCACNCHSKFYTSRFQKRTVIVSPDGSKADAECVVHDCNPSESTLLQPRRPGRSLINNNNTSTPYITSNVTTRRGQYTNTLSPFTPPIVKKSPKSNSQTNALSPESTIKITKRKRNPLSYSPTPTKTRTSRIKSENIDPDQSVSPSPMKRRRKKYVQGSLKERSLSSKLRRSK